MNIRGYTLNELRVLYSAWDKYIDEDKEDECPIPFHYDDLYLEIKRKKELLPDPKDMVFEALFIDAKSNEYEDFSGDKPPRYLKGKWYIGWYNKEVLSLEVGERTKGKGLYHFRRIK